MNKQLAISYIGNIRNEAKRRYARDWYHYLIGFQPEPNDHAYDCGAITKQAVRMQLAKYAKE